MVAFMILQNSRNPNCSQLSFSQTTVRRHKFFSEVGARCKNAPGTGPGPHFFNPKTREFLWVGQEVVRDVPCVGKEVAHDTPLVGDGVAGDTPWVGKENESEVPALSRGWDGSPPSI